MKAGAIRKKHEAVRPGTRDGEGRQGRAAVWHVLHRAGESRRLDWSGDMQALGLKKPGFYIRLTNARLRADASELSGTAARLLYLLLGMSRFRKAMVGGVQDNHPREINPADVARWLDVSRRSALNTIRELVGANRLETAQPPRGNKPGSYRFANLYTLTLWEASAAEKATKAAAPVPACLAA